MRLIESEADLAFALAELMAADPRLRRVGEIAGEVPLRLRPSGFAGLAWIVTGQQLSTASAAAIWRRIEAAFPDFGPATIAAASDDALRNAGLSRPKMRTFRALAAACLAGLDLDALAEAPDVDIRAALTGISGIGPWSVDLYLLFCLRRADLFPAGDLALRIAVADAFGLPERPSAKELADIAALWSPWRAVAARLFWAYYRARGTAAPAKEKESVTV